MLDNALDIGITEIDFWEMTLGELDRRLASYKRKEAHKNKQKAIFDYSLAILIGRAFNASEQHPFPELYDAYPSVFADEIKKVAEERSAKQAQLSAIRFIQFAQSFNRKFAEEANNERD